jgi:molybdate transport system ATP-binding protein
VSGDPVAPSAGARGANELGVQLRARRGAFSMDVDLRVPADGVTGLFGPSGSGKTSLLRCLAGLDREATGRVRIGQELWQDSDTGVFVPCHRRGAACVFQEADLFPHLDVEGNLRYALRRARRSELSREDVIEWLALGPLLARSPASLSGGERQRVSLGRALLSGPTLLLLDEPLSALDEVGRREILPYLESLPERLRIPIVYVSHALDEVARLSDRMVWLVEGRVRGVGAPTELLARVDFARWQGAAASVVVDAVVRRHEEAYELTLLEGPWGEIWVRRLGHAPGESVRVQIDASDVSLDLAGGASGSSRGASSVLNRFDLEVVGLEDVGGGQLLVRLGRDADGPLLLARITRLSRDRLGLTEGALVQAGVKSVAVVG